MLIDRRAFTAASAALVSGCASVGTRRIVRCTPLAPVLADESRIIRTMAGLRPYRRKGFVVRADQLAEKRLVHNYGHGGAGITLSWGTSKLAIELGLKGHNGPVAILGSGVVGLSTARLVQEAGFPVTIYAAALPPDTTSNIAGGQFHPFATFHPGEVTPEFMAQFTSALDYSWRRYQIMVGEDYGIRWLPTYVETGSPEARSIATFPPVNRMLSAAENPFPWSSTLRYDTMYIETGRYLRQMIRDIQVAGGKFEVRRFGAASDIASLPEALVFNCTGLGSRDLFQDQDLRPARGQLAILEPQPEVQYAMTGGPGYMFPRPDGIILGGTFELDEWDASPQPATIARIVENHKRFFASLRCPA
ncbi:FAD-dependent oxidoreductase [Sphingomonas agri]|uniref:FAD-dependent oxidoreductase n=1 Tax=Sphingomonas agri TaxID=1813878 RepID=UPI00311FAF55